MVIETTELAAIQEVIELNSLFEHQFCPVFSSMAQIVRFVFEAEPINKTHFPITDPVGQVNEFLLFVLRISIPV